MKRKNINRLPYIDFLKFIGLTCIIIAHVGSPSWAMMARSFDVPIMVILSSLLAGISYKNKAATAYCVARFKRLVFPTWIFLIIYFSIHYIFSGDAESLKTYIASFALTRYGIGYVWIVLIYLYSAMLVPLFARIKTSTTGLIGIVLAYLAYEIAYHYQFGLGGNNLISTLVDTTFYYIIPYGVLTYLGYNYNLLKKKTKTLIIFFSLSLFIGLLVYYRITTGSFQQVALAKYPPRVYYLSYGVACSFSLLLYCEERDLKVYNNPIIRFISDHSMWIYLWHILVLDIYSKLRLPEIWFVKLVVVYSVSSAIVLAVNLLLNQIELKCNFNISKITKYLRG